LGANADYVKQNNLITDMGDEAQYAVWTWTRLDDMAAWHPCFILPENWRVVVTLGARKEKEGRRTSGSGALLRVPEEKESR
jgi:hypothetical protein